MTSPYSPEPRILSGAIRPVDCFTEGFALVRDQIWLFVGIALVAGILSGFTCTILSGAMTCGVALCYLAKVRRQPVVFDTLFRGFDFFKQSLPLVAIWFVLYLVTSTPNFAYSMAQFPVFGDVADSVRSPGGVVVGYSLSFGTSILQNVVQDVFVFACLFLVDRGVPAIDAAKLAVRVVTSNVGGMLGIVGLSLVAGVLGFLACCVGLLFVMPVVYGALVVAYHQAVPDASAAPPFEPPPPSPYRPPYG